MIITIGILGTMVLGLLELNVRTKKKLKQEENEHMETMEQYCLLSIKHFYLTNNLEGLKEAKKRGLDVEAVKNREIEIKIIKK